MKVAIYARVSTSDKGQDPEMQLVPMREYCQRMSLLWDEYVDYASGAKESRPALDKLMAKIKLREYDILIVWRLSRLARSTKQLIDIVYGELHPRGIGFKCLMQDMDTTTPAGKLVFQIFGAIDEFERELIIENVKEGLANARRKGKILGRPHALDDITLQKLKDAYESNGHNIRAAAREVSIPPGTAHNYLKGN